MTTIYALMVLLVAMLVTTITIMYGLTIMLFTIQYIFIWCIIGITHEYIRKCATYVLHV